MTVSVKDVGSVADGDYVIGFVSEEGGRGRLFSKKTTGTGQHNLPTANGAPVQVVAPAPEDIIDDGEGAQALGGPYYLNLTYDPASPDSGSNGRFLVTDGTKVITSTTGGGT